VNRGSHLDLELLSDYAQGQLAAAVAEGVRAHLEDCEACRAKLAARDAGQPPVREVRAARDPEPGDKLGEYMVGELLGRGGMGLVFSGRQPVIGRDVAIKVLLKEYAGSDEALQRVVHEARAVSAVRHPNIIDILSLGQLPDGRPYLVMPLLQGVSLARLLRRRGRLSVIETLEVLAQALAGLEAAHAAHVIHRDLKPDNIFVDSTTSPWKVTLLDFGIAVRVEREHTRLTQPGVVVGTPSFMSPEQFRGGPEDTTDRLDVYSMGMVAWTLLVGEPPFGDGPVSEVMRRQLSEAVPPPSTRAPEVPPGLDALVLQMVEKEPQLRPTAAQARAAVRALMRGQPVGGLIPSSPRSTRRSSPIAVTIAIAMGLCVAVGAAAGLWFSPAPTERSASAGEPPVVAKPPLALQVPVATPAVVDSAPSAVALDAGDPVPSVPLDEAMRLPCRTIVNITEVESAVVGHWVLFQIHVDGVPPLAVIAQDEAGRGAKALGKLRREVLACRSSRKEVRAERTQASGIWFTTRGTVLPTGNKVRVEDVSIADRAPLRTARRFPCDRVQQVGTVEAAALEPSAGFVVRVEGQPPLLITGPTAGKMAADLQRLRGAVARCKGAANQLELAETIEFKRWAGKRGTVVSDGLRAELVDVSIRTTRPGR
jgi:eukaryotic-like serine/threonine-protein kinase